MTSSSADSFNPWEIKFIPSAVHLHDNLSNSYRSVEYLGAEIIVYSECSLKFPGEDLIAANITISEATFRFKIHCNYPNIVL